MPPPQSQPLSSPSVAFPMQPLPTPHPPPPTSTPASLCLPCLLPPVSTSGSMHFPKAGHILLSSAPCLDLHSSLLPSGSLKGPVLACHGLASLSPDTWPAPATWGSAVP